MASSSSSTSTFIKPRPSSWNPSFPYDVDYNDHFETPLQAYQDIKPLLDWIHPLASSSSTTKTIIYDPYYCNGRSAKLLRSLGYTVIHEKRDFYEDIRTGQVPNEFDIFVTNPPYSEEHKAKCLEFCGGSSCLKNGKPFFLLLPAYVCARSYYRSLLDQNMLDKDILYLVPKHDYQYQHPEGTGKYSSPFSSLWICGMGRENVSLVSDKWKQQQKKITNNKENGPSLYLSLSELEAAGVISTQKRPNPKQRQKKKRNRQQQLDDDHNDKASANLARKEDAAAMPSPNTTTIASQKKSKYRDETGQRRKKRF